MEFQAGDSVAGALGRPVGKALMEHLRQCGVRGFSCASACNPYGETVDMHAPVLGRKSCQGQFKFSSYHDLTKSD